jgi:hypothetical protein
MPSSVAERIALRKMVLLRWGVGGQICITCTCIPGTLAAPGKAHQIKSDAPCCILAHGFGLHAAATVVTSAAADSACRCRFGRDRSFGPSFERLFSPGENKEEV